MLYSVGRRRAEKDGNPFDLGFHICTVGMMVCLKSIKGVSAAIGDIQYVLSVTGLD